MIRFRNITSKIFFEFAGICYLIVLYGVIFKNPYHESARLIPVSLLMLCAVAAGYYCIDRFLNITEKQYRIILAVSVSVIFIMQITAGLMLRYSPVFDVAAVYEGAYEWAITGTFAQKYAYFQKFPFNLGATALLAVFCKAAHILGINDFYTVALTVNSAGISLTILFVSLICKKLFSAKTAVFALLLFLLSPQYIFWGAAFYTDSLSLLFPVLFYYLYLISRDVKSTGKRTVRYILMGLVISVGMLCKMTALIGLAAVLIDMLYNYRIKQCAVMAAVVIAVITSVFSLFYVNIYANHLDKSITDNDKVPTSHWIMMGLNGNGNYSPADYDFTNSFADAKKKKAAIGSVIAQRVKDKGFGGMLKHFKNKLVIDYSDGTYGYCDFFKIDPAHNTFLHRFVPADGAGYKSYSHYCTGMHIVILLLAVTGFFMAFFDKERIQYIAPFAAAFGIMLFLCLWETNRRYFTNFAPFLFLGASYASDRLSMQIKRLTGK